MAAKAERAPPRMSRTSSAEAEAEAGFTLIEMMAVMLIIAVIASLVLPMTHGTGRSQLQALALETATLIRSERVGAVLTGRVRRVAIDGERRLLIGDGGRRVSIPDDVTLDLLGVQEPWVGRRLIVRFDADGSSSGTVVRLRRGGSAYEIRVNWYTGGVTVVDV
jgi:general secretion pathway protein H